MWLNICIKLWIYFPIWFHWNIICEILLNIKTHNLPQVTYKIVPSILSHYSGSLTPIKGNNTALSWNRTLSSTRLTAHWTTSNFLRKETYFNIFRCNILLVKSVCNKNNNFILEEIKFFPYPNIHMLDKTSIKCCKRFLRNYC